MKQVQPILLTPEQQPQVRGGDTIFFWPSLSMFFNFENVCDKMTIYFHFPFYFFLFWSPPISFPLSPLVQVCYCWNLQLYMGKCDQRKLLLGEHKVLLSENVRGSQFNITTDNMFMSLNLTRMLLERGMTLVGTIRTRWREIPIELRDYQRMKLHSSEFAYMIEDQIQLVSYKAKKNNIVLIMSSQHNRPTVLDNANRKPENIESYNKTKGSVNQIDRILHH